MAHSTVVRLPGRLGMSVAIIAVEQSISFQILKSRSRIAHFFCPGANFVQFCLKFRVSESFCGYYEEEEPVLGLLESDDDLRCMIEEYELRELEGKLRVSVWIFVCNVNSVSFDGASFVDKYSDVSVSGDWFCGENNDGFVKLMGVDPNGDDKRERENLFFIFNKFGNKSKKIGDDSLRKMGLKQRLLPKNLDGIRSFCSSRDQSENSISQSRPEQLGSELGSPLNPESNNLDVYGDPTNSTSCSRNSKDGNLHSGRLCSLGSLYGQSIIISANRNGSNQLVPAEKSRRMPFNYSINWMVNGLEPDCEFGTVDRASLRNIDRENIVPPCVDCNVVKRGLVPPTCHHLLSVGAYPLESFQCTGSQRRVHGGCSCIHIHGSGEARYQRACPYRISTRSNANESRKHQNYRLEGKNWERRYYLRLKSSSNITNQGPSYRSRSSAPDRPLFCSYCYEIRGKQRTVDDGHVLNPPYCGEELYNPVGCVVPQQGTSNSEDCQLLHDGGNESLLTMSNSLLGARAVDIDLDPLSKLGVEKIDNADQTLDQTPMNYDEEPHTKNQSSSPHSPFKSIHTELKSENKLLDAKGSHETMDIHQGGAKESKYYDASVLYLSLHNISSESDGKVHPPVRYANFHISETYVKPQSNGFDLMDK